MTCDLCGEPILDPRGAYGYLLNVCMECWCYGSGLLDEEEMEMMRDMLCRCRTCINPDAHVHLEEAQEAGMV